MSQPAEPDEEGDKVTDPDDPGTPSRNMDHSSSGSMMPPEPQKRSKEFIRKQRDNEIIAAISKHDDIANKAGSENLTTFLVSM